MKKVIFLSGLGGGPKDQFVFKRIMKDFQVIYFHYNTGLYEKFEALASQLDRFIRGLNLKKNEKVSLVGVSAGGIILDYYLKFIDSTRVDRAATICSPFGGSYVTAFFSKKRKGLHQAEYKSKFLKKLHSKQLRNVKLISFWSYLDPLVPGTSGRYEKSYHTMFFLHWFVHYWPPLPSKIKNFFTIT